MTKRLPRLTIGLRLGAGFGGLVALMLLIVLIAGAAMLRMGHSLQHAMEAKDKAAQAARWLGLTQVNVTRVMAIARSPGQTAVESHFIPLIGQTDRDIAGLQAALTAANEGEAATSFLQEISAAQQAFEAARVELRAAIASADTVAVDKLLEQKLQPQADRLLKGLDQYGRATVAEADRSVGEVVSGSRWAIGALLVLGTFSATVGIAVSWAIRRSVIHPLNQAVSAASSIAANNLSDPVVADRSDELGALLGSLETMRRSLSEVVRQVKASTECIGHASVEIASGNLDLSTRTELTAASLQHTASAMEQLTGSVKDTAGSARGAHNLAQEAASIAARGGELVEEVVQTMDRIRQASRQVSDITSLIDALAFQTNILALNAAVESARAGTHGRGFAVVAAEVRTLAGKSAEAARQIKSLIERSAGEVEKGVDLVTQTGSTMGRVVQAARSVSTTVDSISAATSEQSEGITKVNAMVSELDRATQQNAALVEQAAAAAASLKEQALVLAEQVNVFQVEELEPQTA